VECVTCMGVFQSPDMGQIGTRVESLGVGALGNTFLVASLVRARRVNLRVQYQAVAITREHSPE
jgi:hypothetical protein